MRKFLFDLFWECDPFFTLSEIDLFFLEKYREMHEREKMLMKHKLLSSVQKKENEEKNTPVKNTKEETKTNNFYKWCEADNNWYMTIPSIDADITVDDKGVEIITNINDDKNDFYISSINKVYKTFPENTVIDSISAKKVGDYTIITILKKETNKRKLIIK